MGELSLFNNYPLKNNAEAIEATILCIIDSNQINDLIGRRPSIALKIMKELSIRLEKTESLIESLRLRNVEQRIADILLTMADDNNIVNLSISKKDLASHIGISQETLSRKLSRFQEKGWMRQEGQRKIIILKRKILEDIVSL